MPESLLDRRLKLGTFLGIGLYVHWTFLLVVVWVAISARSGGANGIAFAIAQLLGVFTCVTLHEYGHAMAARRYGIGTADITLLPIGGVARLRRMPRIPFQELVVAVAGPAVNVVIVALLLLGFLFLTDGSSLAAMVELGRFWIWGTEMSGAATERINLMLEAPSVVGYAVFMLIVNTMLVVFNMIPAFPMDGGRVFRSVMAMSIDYRQATRIASRVGLVCAVLMAIVALNISPSNPIPVLIAAFIGYAGIAEARQVEVMESVRGITAREVMIRTEMGLPMDLPLREIVRHWQSISMPALPVVSLAETVVGMIYLSDVAKAIDSGVDGSTTAGQLVDHDTSAGTVRADEMLESALMRTGRHRRQIPVVDDNGRLLGVLDLDSMLSRRRLASSAASPINPFEQPAAGRFDQTT